jgi:hypothetical protein
MIRSIATKLKKEKLKLTVAETLALLRQQDRLSKQLRECAAARLEAELAGKKMVAGGARKRTEGHIANSNA